MSAVLYAGLVLVGIGVGAVLAMFGGTAADYVRSALERDHGQHHAPRPTDPFARVRTSLVTPPGGLTVAQQAEHAGAMHAASLPYLPAPRGEHPYPLPSVRADLPVTPVRTAGHAPWTGSFPAVQDPDAEMAAEISRVAFVRSQLPLHAEDVTREDMERALALLRELPPSAPEPRRYPCCACCLGSTVPCQPPDMHLASCAECDGNVYGEVPVASVLAGEQADWAGEIPAAMP